MDFLIRIAEWFKGIPRAIDRKLIVPLMVWIVQFFSRKIDMRVEGEGELSDWKKDALKDFKFWLEDLPDQADPAEEATPQSCDLYTLLSEFSALRQEIKMQNREQDKSLQTIDTFTNTYHEAVRMFKEKAESLEALEEKIQMATEKRTVKPFLDIRDALIRGRNASLEVAEIKGLFKSAPKGIEGIVEGYEMALRRFDRALEMVGVSPVDTVNQQFDPKTMKAVEKRSAPDTETGTIIEEQVCGFIWNDEVIRLAEVVVSA